MGGYGENESRRILIALYRWSFFTLEKLLRAIHFERIRMKDHFRENSLR